MPAPARSDLIDAVDSQNRIVGTVRRGDVFEVVANFRTVHVFVLRSTGELLLQKIGTSNQRGAGLWGSSVAGYIHAGEEPLAAARRRLREEVGLSTPLTHVGTHAMRDENVTKFVDLYLTRVDRATIEDASVERLWYWERHALETRLREHPEDFTATFRGLYRVWNERARILIRLGTRTGGTLTVPRSRSTGSRSS